MTDTKSFFESKTFNLKILSPIHIGTGESLDLMDYVFKNNRLYRISSDLFFKILEERKLKDYFLSSDISKIDIKEIALKVMEGFDPDQHDYIFFVNLEKGLAPDFCNKYFNPDSKMQIDMSLRSGDEVIIPGSSIKGSIRTAFLNSLAEKVMYNNNSQERELMLECNNAKQLKNPINDPFKFISISDVALSNKTNIVELRRTGSKGGDIPAIKEVILPEKNKNNSLTITIKNYIRDRWDNNHQPTKLKQELRDLNLNTLLQSVDDFYRNLLDREKNFYINNSFFDMLRKEEGFLIRLGFGCGNLSYSIKGCLKTIGKTRFLANINNQKLPLGYAIITEK